MDSRIYSDLELTRLRSQFRQLEIAISSDLDQSRFNLKTISEITGDRLTVTISMQSRTVAG